jgi:tetratricopeptide (TPR) repeat protein
MDVVFVHGLGGDAATTWRHGRDESTSWPHWVGNEHADIGVWSLGYAASPSKLARIFGWFGWASRDAGHAMALPDRAKQVADQLVKKGLGQRPLVFVGHSLGGLLTKQLLRCSVDAGDASSLRTIAANTRGVLFLGTPHTGADLATLGDRFRKVFGTTVAIENLRAHDPHLRDLYDWYRKHAPRLGVMTATYFELRGVAGGTVTIVDPTSSHPGIGDDPIGLDEDHLTLAKPRESDSQVCEALRELIVGVRSGKTTQSSPVSAPAALFTAPVPAAPQVVAPPTVVVQVAAPAGPVSPPSVPRELPPRAEHYFGRHAERERLAQRLRERRNTAVVGPGGLGKTALAAEALHALGDATLERLYPDGSLYLDLYATHANRDAIWSRLANRLAGPGFLDQSPPRARAEEACSGKRLLLIIEGGEEADGHEGRADLADLLSVIPADSIRLLLTREAKQAVPVESITLREALEPDDAAALFDTLSGNRLVGNDRDQLLTLLAGHPLALTWAGNLLARDDEHPNALLQDWTDAVLPPLTNPTNNTHTLRWLYDRSARGLDEDARWILAAAGVLAHAPIPLTLIEVAIDGDDQQQRARAALRALADAGLIRISPALPGHWQFGHVLAYRYARERVAVIVDPLPVLLAKRLQALLSNDCIDAGEPAAAARIARGLDHMAILLRSESLAGDAGWPIAGRLIYYWQDQLLDRGRSDLARYALDVVEAWMNARPNDRTKKPKSAREYGVLHERRGNLLALQGDLANARKHYENSLMISQRLAKAEPGNAELQRDLAIGHHKLGIVLFDQGDLLGAQEHYEADLSIMQRLTEAAPGDDELQRDLNVSFIRLGNMHFTQGDLSGAQARYKAALNIAQQLAKSAPDNTEWQRDLSISLEKLGEVQLKKNDLTSVKSYFDAVLKIRQQLAKTDPGNAQWQSDLSYTLTQLAIVDERTGDLPGALHYAETSLAIRLRLAALDPADATFRRDAGISQRQVEHLRQKLHNGT